MAMSNPQADEQDPLLMTEAEYLVFEEQSEFKHEYARGRVYAMMGASVSHNIINVNVSTILGTHIEKKPCVVMSSDMRVKVDSEEVSYRYPDTLVICGELEMDENAPNTVTNPVVIVEVLSASTVMKDYNEKLEEYHAISSLQEYVIVSQHTAKVEVYSRHESGRWLRSAYRGRDASFELASIHCTLDLARVYRNVTLDNEASQDIK